MADLLSGIVSEVLGNTPEQTTFKRTSDKIDGYLAVALTLVAMVMFTVYWGRDMILCVPAECAEYPGSIKTDCARKWDYQNEMCEDEILTWPDTNFHYMLILIACLFLGLMGLPIYQGEKQCQKLFSRFYEIWTTIQNDTEGKLEDKDWTRDMNLLVEQLKSDSHLSRKYATYHTLGLFCVMLSSVVVSLYTLHFFGVDLACSDDTLKHNSTLASDSISSFQCTALSYFKQTNRQCSGNHFVCDANDQNISAWFGAIAMGVLGCKGLINLLCIMFSLGLPGLFGRRCLVFLGQLTDASDRQVYYIQANPVKIINHTMMSLLFRVFVAPMYSLMNCCKFYFTEGRKSAGEASRTITQAGMQVGRSISKSFKAKNDSDYGAITEQPVDEESLNDPLDSNTSTDQEDEEVEDVSRTVPTKPQNWCDLFFILEILSHNTNKTDVLIFISKIEQHIPPISAKQVDKESSYYDTRNNSLIILFTHAGVIETLLEDLLMGRGGLYALGWLEAGEKTIWPEDDSPEECLSQRYIVNLGCSYTLVAAVYGKGRMLVRLNNFTFQLKNQKDVKKLKKKYGEVIPLSCMMVPQESETRAQSSDPKIFKFLN